jgi:hypothetical protein
MMIEIDGSAIDPRKLPLKIQKEPPIILTGAYGDRFSFQFPSYRGAQQKANPRVAMHAMHLYFIRGNKGLKKDLEIEHFGDTLIIKGAKKKC